MTLDEARNKYGKKVVEYTTLDGQTFYIRPLKRKEFREIVLDEDLDSFAMEERLCSIAIVYPEEYDFSGSCNAGVPTELAGVITEYSCFIPEVAKERLNVYREAMNEEDNKMVNMIIEAFPRISFDDLDNMSNDEVLQIYARAEWTLINLRGVPLSIGEDSSGDSVAAQTMDELQRRIEQEKRQLGLL